MWGFSHMKVYPGMTAFDKSSMPFMNGSPYGVYQNNYSNMPQSGAGFAFKKRFERVDWKKIASADIDNISRNLDFNTLQDNIMNITFCNIESELDVRMIDPNFVKLFKLAQLTIEYLLHSQDYLSGMVGELEGKVKEVMKDQEETKNAKEKIENDLGEVKKEAHKRKKMLLAQQQIIQSGSESYNKCPYCSKAFINGTFLQSHMARRHADDVTQYNALIGSQLQHVPQSQPPPQSQASEHAPLERELSEIRERLQFTESQLVEERNARNLLSQKEKSDLAKRDLMKDRELEKWKEEQEVIHREEMDKMRDMFMRELKELSEKNHAAQEAVTDLQMNRLHSNLGVIRPDEEHEKRLLQQQREEVAVLREQLAQEVSSVRSDMQKKVDKQEKGYNKKIKQLSRQHRQELKQVNDVLEKSVSELQKEKRGRGQVETAYQQKLDNMQDVIQKSRANEKRLAEQETRPVPARRSPVQQPLRRTPPRSGQTQIEDYEEDSEDLTEEETDEETENDRTSTMGTATMGTTWGTGSLSMSGDRGSRVLAGLKDNPTLLKEMRRVIQGTVDDSLQKRGVPADAIGIKLDVFNDKLQTMKTQRMQIAKKYKNFFDIRQQVVNEVEQQARQRIRSQARPASAAARATPPMPRRSASPPKPASAPTTPRRSPTHSRRANTLPVQRVTFASPQGEPPRPAPRTNSPRSKMMGSSTLSSGGLSQHSAGSRSLDNDDSWESGEDESEEEEQDRPTKPKVINQHKTPAYSEDDEDSTWGSASELQEISPIRGQGSKGSSLPVSSTPQNKPISQRARTIEMQLQNRGQHNMAGAVDTLPMQSSTGAVPKRTKPSQINFDSDEDDDMFRVTSEEDDPVHNKPAPRKQPSRSSMPGDTDASNTYGTSVWGSSSKGGSMDHPSGFHTEKGGRTSLGTLSDWDNDLNIDDL